MKRAWIAGFALACAEPEPCATTRDLLRSEAGLTNTRAEHPEGWGRASCADCHPAGTYHLEDCLGGVAVDVEALDAERPEDCVPCHGTNGVDAWEELLP